LTKMIKAGRADTGKRVCPDSDPKKDGLRARVHVDLP